MNGIMHLTSPKKKVLVSALLWAPVLWKLGISGDLGCGNTGCWRNIRAHVWQTIGHLLQGVFAGLLLIPWVRCHSGRELDISYEILDLGYPRGGTPEAGGTRGEGREQADTQQEDWKLWVKNIVGGGFIVVYPIYNLIKRWKTSNSDKHPYGFFRSSFFINGMMLVLAFDTVTVVSSLILLIFYKGYGTPLLGVFACEHRSFRYVYVPVTAILLVVLLGAVVLSATSP